MTVLWRRLRVFYEGRGWDFVVLVADRLVRLPLGLWVAGAMGGSLGPEAFGWLSHGLAVVGVAMVFSQLGLDLVVVRRVARDPERAPAIMAGAFLARLAAGMAIAITGFVVVASGFAPRGEDAAILGVLALGVFVPAVGVPALWFQARTRNRVAVAAAFWVFLMVTALRLRLVAEGASVLAFAWVAASEWVLTAAVVALAMWKEGGRLDICAGIRELRSLLLEGWPLLVGALASSLYLRLDLVLIRWMRGAEEAGVYAAAIRLSELAYGVPALLGMVFMASLSGTKGGHSAEAGVDGYFRASAALGYLLVLPIILIAPWLIPTLFGAAYFGAVLAAQIHAGSVFFLCLTLARGRALVARGQGKFTMVSALVGLLIALPLQLLLIPHYGGVGAAWATVGTHAFAGLGLTLLYRPTRDIGGRLVSAILRPSFRGLL